MTDLVPLPPTAAEVERHWTKADFRNAEKAAADYSRREYTETGHRHGTVVYESDVRNFLAGGCSLD